jgi:hypothetical protein
MSPAPGLQVALPTDSPALTLSPAGKQPSPASGRLVEIGEGWWRAVPGGGERPYYWHRKNDVKQFHAPVLSAEVLGQRLLAAIGERDVAMQEAMLSEGADINASDPVGTTGLMKAVLQDDIASLSLLLRHAPDLERRNNLGRSALHIAAYWGRIGVLGDSGCLGALMRAGCDLAAVAAASGTGDGTGQTAMDLACAGLSAAESPKTPHAPQRTPRTPRTPSTPGALPSKEDVELLLRLGPDAYEEQKRQQLDAAKAKRDAAKKRAMAAALAKARSKLTWKAPNGAVLTVF